MSPRFPDDYSIAELHAIATRAFANGDDYARAFLREQLKEEEFSERGALPDRARARHLCVRGPLRHDRVNRLRR
jgi:hypothetical protein